MIDNKSVALTHVVALGGLNVLGKAAHVTGADICFSQCFMLLITDRFADVRRGRDRYDLDLSSRERTSGPSFLGC